MKTHRVPKLSKVHEEEATRAEYPKESHGNVTDFPKDECADRCDET